MKSKENKKESNKRRINWEALIAAGGLFLSVYQNYRNDLDSKVEDKKDSTRMSILIDTYKHSIKENKRIRLRDSIQTATLIKEYKTLKEANEITTDANEAIARSSSPFFLLEPQISPTFYIHNGFTSFSPFIKLRNIGRVNAQQVTVSCFVATLDNYLNRITHCSNLNSKVIVKEIAPNKPELVHFHNNSIKVPVEAGPQRDSTGAKVRYTYVLLVRIIPSDAFLSKQYEQFFAAAYSARPLMIDGKTRTNAQSFEPSPKEINYFLLKKCAIEHGFNYKKMIDVIRDKSNYNKNSQYFFY